jgi:ubiquinone biosynthesis protein COQ9
VPATGPPSHRAILDAALELGERRGWRSVHLYDVARATGATLADIQRHYENKDALAEAWFDRADAALLAMPDVPGWTTLPLRQRLHGAICAWLGALSPHRRLSGTMLLYKLQPEHLHLHARGVWRVSRTVQWIREVAQVPSIGWRQEIDEAVLTAIYLSTLAHWLADGTPNFERTRRLLDRLLGLAGRATLRGPSPLGED